MVSVTRSMAKSKKQVKHIKINEKKNTTEFYFIDKKIRKIYFRDLFVIIKENIKNRREIRKNLAFE